MTIQKINERVPGWFSMDVTRSSIRIFYMFDKVKAKRKTINSNKFFMFDRIVVAKLYNRLHLTLMSGPFAWVGDSTLKPYKITEEECRAIIRGSFVRSSDFQS
jgi:hypothetical protein